jgi:hypothetical protein
MGHVATVGDYRQGATSEAGDDAPRLGLREHPVACPPHDEGWDLQKRETVNQHLALAEGAHQGTQCSQVGFQVTRRLGQPALFGQPLARDVSGGCAKSSTVRPQALW